MTFGSLLGLAGLTVLVALFIGRRPWSGFVLAGLYGLQLLALLSLLPGSSGLPGPTLELFGHTLGWRLDALSWVFLLAVLLSAAASAWYTGGEWGETYTAGGGRLRWLQVALALNVLAMLVLLTADDFLAFFIGWEMVGWAGFLLMLQGGREAQGPALRYLTYAIGGAMALLLALVLVVTWTGTLAFAPLVDTLGALAAPQLWLLGGLFATAFAIKLGLLPFHLWQAPAYAVSPGPGAAFLSAIAARMGLFGAAVVLVRLIGTDVLTALYLVPDWFSLRDLLAWVAVLTIILPTYTALKQNDARWLLAWHGIGQGGYMMLGLVLSDSLGTAGGLLHMLNYATYQAPLMLAVFAVVHRTGTADLNRLGGLVVRMPLTFLVMLLGIIGLAGLPPMNGFVSKWLIYRSLVTEGMPLLFLGTVIGTLGTILSVYKLIHNTFLGQLRAEHEQVREAPWSMTLPMLALCALAMVTGVFPGLFLEPVAQAQLAMGVTPVPYTVGGVETAAGSLDMRWISGVLMFGFGVAAVLFYGAGPARRVHQLDNYAGGHFLTADVRYQYSDNFYAGLMHRIGGWYRGSFQALEQAVGNAVGVAAAAVQGFYRQMQPALWAVVAATLVIGWGVL